MERSNYRSGGEDSGSLEMVVKMGRWKIKLNTVMLIGGQRLFGVAATAPKFHVCWSNT